MSAPSPVPTIPDRLRVEKLEKLLEVAKMMAVQRDLHALIDYVLEEAKQVADAERGTVWLRNRDRRELFTFVAQGLGDARAEPLVIPEDRGIAGAVVESGRAQRVHDAYSDPQFDPTTDERTGFRTRNILAVPMWAVDQSVFGVLQILNKKEGVDGGRFTDMDQDLLVALGSQAAAALQSAMLYEENQKAFEGFIGASVIAIEARDPTTSGHSGRVAQLTVGLAEAVDRLGLRRQWDPGRDGFTPDEMLEIRYAALLHDFGKIGVREEVLVKAEKLYPYERDAVLHRLDYARRTLEAEMWKQKFELVSESGARAAGEALHQQEERYQASLAELTELEEFVMSCNRPTVLEEGQFERLRDIQKRTFRGPHDQPAPLLSEDEVLKLSIRRGSLSQEERLEIESHVTHTYKFLKRIPWSRNLRGIPEIAYGHHEKLDGKGYPLHLGAPAIRVQTRMMTVSDIYDALTASDRPYKKAVPHQKALDILSDEANRGMIDPKLLQIFIEAKIPQVKLARSATG